MTLYISNYEFCSSCYLSLKYQRFTPPGLYIQLHICLRSKNLNWKNEKKLNYYEVYIYILCQIYKYIFSAAANLAGDRWKLHPDWVYCEYNYGGQSGKMFDTPETNMVHFLNRLEEVTPTQRVFIGYRKGRGAAEGLSSEEDSYL